MTHIFEKPDMVDIIDEVPDEGAVVYTVAEVATKLACSTSTVREMVKRGTLPAIEIGSRQQEWRISKRAVAELLRPVRGSIRRQDLVDIIRELRVLATKLEMLMSGPEDCGGPRKGRA